MKTRKPTITGKSPPPASYPSFAYPTSMTAKQTGDAFKVDEKTVRRWAGRENDPAPHERLASGELRFDFLDLLRWQGETGISGRPGRPDGSSPADDGFWYSPTSMAAPPADPEGPLINMPFERDLADGLRKLSDAEVVKYVHSVVRLRQLLMKRFDELAPWLIGVDDTDEMKARMRSTLYGVLNWHCDQVMRLHDAQDNAVRDGETGELLKADTLTTTAGESGKGS